MSDILNTNISSFKINVNKKTISLMSCKEETNHLVINNNRKIKENSKIKIKVLDYISIAKIISAFSVVIMHTNGIFWNFDYQRYSKYWISSNAIESIFYFAVPVFVLCIGATLLDFNEKYGLKEYYYRRFLKVIVPLFLWNIILYYYRVYFLKNLQKEKLNFVNIWNLFYSSRINSIFSSFHHFIITYMIIPLIAYVDKSKKIELYSYCFITLIITQSLIPYLIKIFEPNLLWIYTFNPGFIIYIFPGYIIQNYKFPVIFKIIIYILGFIGLIIHMYGTQILTIKHKEIIRLHKGYFNIPCILYSCSIFLFIKEYSYCIQKIINRKYINIIGALTIGPFFIHLPMIDTIHKYFNVDIYDLNYRLFGGIAICSISLIITFIMKKIPIINYLVP